MGRPRTLTDVQAVDNATRNGRRKANERRAKNLANGLCAMGCRAKLVTKTYCKKHRDYMRDYRANGPPAEKRLKGQCRDCPAMGHEGALFCKDCAKKARDRSRRWFLNKKHGLRPEAYDALLAKQENKCAICHRIFEEGGHANSSAHVDHIHGTKKIRGLLCGNCNWAIGLFRDSLENLRSALRYLRKKPVQESRS